MLQNSTNLHCASRAFVFQQIDIEGREFYMHYDCDNELNLYAASLLTKAEHQQLLDYD